MSDDVKSWIGRKVRIVDDGIEGTVGEEGVIIAVDDTPYRPSAWVKVDPDAEYPSYRSCDLCWLIDLATDECGPAWGTGGFEADVERSRRFHPTPPPASPDEG